MESAAANCPKVRLMFYQSTFCFFFLGQWLVAQNKYFFSLFAVDFKKVPKHYFLNLNTDECGSTVLIKNGSVLYFNHQLEFIIVNSRPTFVSI